VSRSTVDTRAGDLAADGRSFAGQPCVVAQAADGARAVVLLHGGQLVSWRSADGRERVYLSPNAGYGAGQAVRGGVPVVFPQFERRGPDTTLPRHGFARTAMWRVATRAREGAAGVVSLRLEDDAATRAIWPHPFRLELSVRVEGRRLELELACANTGDAPLDFSAALHSYLATDDLAALRLEGLQGASCIDSAAGATLRVDAAPQLGFGAEVDRIYLGSGTRSLRLHEPSRALRIESPGWRDTVVWNPGAAKAALLADLPAGGERGFVCVEAACVTPALRLAPGATWHALQRLDAER
jgi:glucose-6-phosphate 1-epimerase